MSFSNYGHLTFECAVPTSFMAEINNINLFSSQRKFQLQLKLEAPRALPMRVGKKDD